jgi:tRNA G18 (ribose-2'-O)-methylase SpoU
VAQASVEEIDRLNILQASLLAMRRAVDALGLRPDEAWIDGNRCPGFACPERAIVSGDRLHAVISAASVLAKTARDAEMLRMHERYPQYWIRPAQGLSHLRAPRAAGAPRAERNPPPQLRAGAALFSGFVLSAITSRDNPRVAPLARVGPRCAHASQREAGFAGRRALIAALLDSGGTVEALILSKSAAPAFGEIARRCAKSPVVLADSVFKAIADTGTPAGIAAEVALPDANPDLKRRAFLRVPRGHPGRRQRRRDPAQRPPPLASGMRCSAPAAPTPGRRKYCAPAWARISRWKSPNTPTLARQIANFGGKVACTVPRGGTALADAQLTGRIGWLFGAEGQGVSTDLIARADMKITIPMSSNAESLNVAAAAAICFYEWSRSRE